MEANEIIEEHIGVVVKLKEKCNMKIDQLGRACANALQNGNCIFLMGNGGSAADSQHIAAEFVGRFVNERKGLPAIAFTTDTSILTAVGNDYGYENVFKRQVEALVKEKDVVIGISTSGNSQNVIRAIDLAKEKGAYTVGLSGNEGGKLEEICDICITVPSKITARIQECHIMIGHIICGIVDEVLCNEK